MRMGGWGVALGLVLLLLALGIAGRLECQESLTQLASRADEPGPCAGTGWSSREGE